MFISRVTFPPLGSSIMSPTEKEKFDVCELSVIRRLPSFGKHDPFPRIKEIWKPGCMDFLTGMGESGGCLDRSLFPVAAAPGASAPAHLLRSRPVCIREAGRCHRARWCLIAVGSLSKYN